MSGSTGAHVNISSYAKEEHDGVEYRKRVATYVDGNTFSYEDSNFTSGESPAVIDFFADSGGRIAHEGSIVNDGPGDIRVEFSSDGTTYGGQHTLHGSETLNLSNLKIKRIRLTYVDPAEYRIIIA